MRDLNAGKNCFSEKLTEVKQGWNLESNEEEA
jgi:hypothetical protein